MSSQQFMWVKSDGLTLEVREVSSVKAKLVTDRAAGRPLPILNEIMTVEDARAVVKDQMSFPHVRLA